MSGTVLKFDKMDYDTTLAKNFLSQHPKFVGFNCTSDGERTVRNSIGNVICLSKTNDQFYIEVEDTKNKLLNLSHLVEENIDMFCQLEYLIRGIKPDELRAFDLKLIIKNLQLCSSDNYRSVKVNGSGLSMNNDSPLVKLAHVADHLLYTDSGIYIFSQKETAIVCWLFVHLCHKAGFANKVSLCFTEDIPKTCKQTEYILEIQDSKNGGCIAVVTGKADIDTAVDILADAPHKAPWGIRRVFVQENILERFRTSLKGKARVCPGEVDEVLSRRSSSAFAIGDKTFLIEYAGETSEGIVVEAYRTVKELMSLLGQVRPYALSVWCDSVSESNEIAHGTTCDIVWLNTYAEFDGPPQICKGLLARTHCGTQSVSSDFKRACREWKSLPVSERAARLKVLLDKYNVGDMESFYCVRKNFTCAGTERPAGIVIVLGHIKIPNLLKYLLEGGSIVYKSDENGIFDVLKNTGVPVEKVNKVENGDCLVYEDFVYRQKLIWTSYGITFAN